MAFIFGPRHRQIIKGVGLGLSNGEIAESLGIAENTVKVYITRLLERMDGRCDRHDLIGMGLLLGLISVADLTRRPLEVLQDLNTREKQRKKPFHIVRGHNVTL